MEEHAKNCVFSEGSYKCACNETVANAQKDDHDSKYCSFRLVQCPLDDCKVDMRWTEKDHQRKHLEKLKGKIVQDMENKFKEMRTQVEKDIDEIMKKLDK